MIRLGIVGLGYMGMNYAKLALQDERVELVASCDSDATHLEALGRVYPATKARLYRDFAEMVEAERLDAVYIALPDDFHRAPVLAAAERGLHILVEKPLATNLTDGEDMLAAVSRAGIVCQVNHCLRWYAPLYAAKQRLAAGEFGKVLCATAWAHDRIVAPTRRLTWASRTSPVWFQMTHLIDAVRWLTGSEAVEVYAEQGTGCLRSRGVDTPDFVRAFVTYSGGERVYYDASWIYPESSPSVAPRLFELVCTDGMVRVDTERQGLETAGQRYESAAFFGAEMFGRVSGLFADSFTSFVDCLTTGRIPAVTAEDGLAVVKTACAVEQSIREKRPVRLEVR